LKSPIVSECTRKPDFYFSTNIESHVVKKNNRPIHGRGQKKWIGKSDRLRTAEQWLILELKSWANNIGMKEPLRGDIHAIFRFYFDSYWTANNRRSRTLPDLSNLLELPQDCLQCARIIDNDTDVCCLDGSGRFPGIRNRLEIELYILDAGLFERRSNFAHLLK
jgi:Holliday junction resolvase RusA-like endonuclease